MTVVLMLLSGLALSGDGAQTGAAVEAARQTRPEDGAAAAPPPRLQDRAAAAPPSPEIVVTARHRPDPGDPLQAVNLESFKLTQKADDAFVAPAARLYEHGLPAPVRTGLRNVLKNLHEPVVFLNYLLQFKPGKAAETAGRFVVNSSLGVAGIVDVARKRPFNLPRRRNGFANTLGFYGVGPGPFFFLPFVGPTTARDLLGDFVDRSLLPLAVRGPFRNPAFTAPAAILGTLDRRIELDHLLATVRNSPNAYVMRRDLYLQRRRDEIAALHGRQAAPLLSAPAPAPVVQIAPPVAAPPQTPPAAPPDAAPPPATPGLSGAQPDAPIDTVPPR